MLLSVGLIICRNTSKGVNPLSFATEIIIEIKQFNFGRMASHAFIESILRNHFIIENGLLD